jgi:predicted nucleic acid-binding protein
MAMRGILVDTSAYAEFKRGVSEAAQIIQYAPVVGINSIVVGEILSGFAAGSKGIANQRDFARFLSSDRVQVYSVDQVTARHYASIYWTLRRKGRPIPTNDMWIAASALQHGLAVFSYDRHFESVEGIVSGHYLANFIV